ncbi:cryptochrome [Schizopora paradoxa]|uniref:Cryptochrome DASH n=1 Tax=Schizopora paradoxa TaxID=27342 RepID=A0A0H2RHI7_9AGAM|nr:cryptochrome [Schizopora paradoxa]
MSQARALIYLIRKDLRLSDNIVFNTVASERGISHLIPLYVLNPSQYELSGLTQVEDDLNQTYPYPEARSRLGGFWRCGPHRVKFLAESLFDLKSSLKAVGSDLLIRAGKPESVISEFIQHLDGAGITVDGVWLTRDFATEEVAEERAIARALPKGVKLRIFDDESTLVHSDLDHPISKISDTFTDFRKSVEPLRTVARAALETPKTLPSLPDGIPPQSSPFVIPQDLEGLITDLQTPLLLKPDISLPPFPPNTNSAHSFIGGESRSQERLKHLISSGAASTYKDTRNGLLGSDFSTKLSAYLSHGCISARQIHAALKDWEDAHNGGREDKGTAAIRFELLWRDYMRFCLEKYGSRFFHIHGFHAGVNAKNDKGWNDARNPDEWKHPDDSKANRLIFDRWLLGRTSTGLIDASQRELILTGYTSNRARQNVASFLSKHLRFDWRLGAEWYESWLVDYDTASNWGNWAYVAGVGNDPRSRGGLSRMFNPVKQAHDYDPEGEYIKAWVEEARGVRSVPCVWQLWKLPETERKKRNVEDALVRINWTARG